MRASLKRLAALAAALLFTAISCFPAAAAAMPAGWTEAQVSASIPKAEKLAEALLKSGGMPDVNAAVYGMLFSDGTLNALFGGVYKAFSENESTLSALGIDTSVQSVANALQGWPGVYGALNGKTSWAEVLPNVAGLKWNVKSRDSFGGALAGILSPLNPLLYTLLCGGTYTIAPLVTVQGAAGYQNAVVPLLQSLGCKNVMTQEQFAARAQENTFNIARDLSGMLFSALDSFLAAPVTSACRYLPGVAYFLENDGLKNMLKTLMEPLTIRVAVFSLPGVDRLLENADAFSSDVDLKAMLEKADLGAIAGSDTPLKLAPIDLSALAACGAAQNGAYAPNEAKAFIELLNWILETVKLNAGALPAALSGLSSFLQKPTTELTGLILKILNLQSAPIVLEYSWSFPPYTPGAIEYTPTLTRDDYARMLEKIDETLDAFLTEFTEMGSLSDTVRKSVYSNKLVTTLVKALYGALDTEDAAGMLSILGLDASPAGLAKSVSRSHPAAARYLSARTTWTRVYPEGVSWGFADGSKEGFTSAVTAALRPFAPMLRFLLAEGSVTVMDAITLSGGNGYNTAVIPILEGIGCSPEDITPYASYKSASDAALITGILTPVTALLDRVCEKPVAVLCSILPQIAYSLDSDLLRQSVDNLLFPVKHLLQELGMESMLPAELTNPGSFDLSGMLGSLTANSDLGISLPEPDLAAVKALGTAESRASRRTEKGLPAQYTYIAADEPAVLLTVLRYVFNGIRESGDTSLLGSFSMGGNPDAPEGMDMMSVYTEKVTEQLKTMTTDETIEWLFNLLFSETPVREQIEDPGFIPTIIYEEKPDHTARNRALLIAGVVLALALLVVFLVKFDFHKASERRQQRKKTRARKKTEAPARAPKKKAPARTSSATARPGTPRAKSQPAARQNTGASGYTPPPPPLTERELRRKYRQTKKADRLYKKMTRS